MIVFFLRQVSHVAQLAWYFGVTLNSDSAPSS